MEVRRLTFPELTTDEEFWRLILQKKNILLAFLDYFTLFYSFEFLQFIFRQIEVVSS